MNGFDRVLCDEAYVLKNRRRKTDVAINLLETTKMWFVSATLMVKHVEDLESGYY